MAVERGAAIPPDEEGTMDAPVRNWQEWAAKYSEAAAERDRYRAALERVARMANALQADPVSSIHEGLAIRDCALAALDVRGDAAIEVLRDH